MKKFLCFSTGCIICLVSTNGYSRTGECIPTTCPGNLPSTLPQISGCENPEYECYKLADDSSGEILRVPYCNKCTSGYTQIINQTYNSNRTWSYGTRGNACNSFTYPILTCEQNTQPCTGCTNCTTSNWSNPMGGYEVRVVKTCECNTCKSSTEFRCKIGYYGTPTTVGSGCTRCPALNDTYGTTENAAQSGITACLFPANTPVIDDTGTYEFITACKYTN